MIGYLTLGTNDLPRAAGFYDALLAEIGAKRLFEVERGIFWGVAQNRPALGEGFYAGYFRDLDGNKLNVFCMG